MVSFSQENFFFVALTREFQFTCIYSLLVTTVFHQNCIELAVLICSFHILSWGKIGWVGEGSRKFRKQSFYLLCCVSVVGVLEPTLAVSRCVQMELYFHFFLMTKKQALPFCSFLSSFCLCLWFLFFLCLALSVSLSLLQRQTSLWL